MSTARELILEAQTALQDEQGTHWTIQELVRYLNRAQRDLQQARPDTTARVENLDLAAGYEQNLPSVAALLIDVPANVTGERITKTDLVVLDAFEPNWRKRSPANLVRHFMHDARTPRRFLVYPPVVASTRVQLEYSAHPAVVAEATTLSAVSGDLSVAPQWRTCLLFLVLHHAYAKDAESAANAALSASYLTRAQEIAGVDLEMSTGVAPKS